MATNLSQDEEFEFRARLEQEQKSAHLSLYERTLRGQTNMPEYVGKGIFRFPEHLPEKIGEGALSAVSRVPAAIAGGLHGIWEAAGNGPPGSGAQAVQDTVNAMTYQPRSLAGQRTAIALNKLPELLGRIPDKFGSAVAEAGGSPLGGAMANSGLNLIMMGAGMPGGPKPPMVKPVTTISKALDKGFTLTPTQLEKGVVLRALEGLAGSPKSEILASFKNQKNANNLIGKDFGIEGRNMTDSDFSAIRSRAGKAYEDVKTGTNIKYIKPDGMFKQDLQNLRGDFTKAADEYPELMSNIDVDTIIETLNRPASPRAMIEMTKKLRDDANMNLKAFDKPGQRELGFAQRNAATALEDQIDRALMTVGKPGLVDEWRKARRTIAKSYDAEAAFNSETGNFSMPVLARMAAKGKPFTGGMKDAADFARSFEGSARAVDKMKGSKNEFGYGDLLLGGIGGLAGHAAGIGLGSPAGLGLVLARPIVRHALLSKPFQSPRMTMADLAQLAEPARKSLMVAPALGLRMPDTIEEQPQ